MSKSARQYCCSMSISRSSPVVNIQAHKREACKQVPQLTNLALGGSAGRVKLYAGCESSVQELCSRLFRIAEARYPGIHVKIRSSGSVGLWIFTIVSERNCMKNRTRCGRVASSRQRPIHGQMAVSDGTEGNMVRLEASRVCLAECRVMY